MSEVNTIITPYIHDFSNIKKVSKNCYFVGKDSPIYIHKLIEDYSRYFKLEGGFDFTQYTALEDIGQKKCKAYIFVNENWEGVHIVGACAFRFLGDIGQSNKWSLQWVWFHPFFRNRGLLTSAWSYFKSKFFDFDVEPPISKAMEGFLKKRSEESK